MPSRVELPMGEKRNGYDRALTSEQLQILLMRRAARLHAYVRRKISSHMRSLLSPEDILQEVWIACFRNVATFRANEPDAFDRWLRTITDRKIVDAIRWAKRLKRGVRARFERMAQRRTTSFADLFGRVAAIQRTPSSEEGARETAVAVQIALSSLPDAHRTAITLYHIDGKSRKEVAQAMERSIPAVHGLLFRGMQKLRDELGPAHKFMSCR